MDAEQLTCIICCTNHPDDCDGLNFFRSAKKRSDDDGEDEDGPSTARRKKKRIFNRFCKDLLSLRKLELERSLSVCSSCLGKISFVMETNGKVDEVEGRVRSLQLSILKELRQLQTYLEVLEGQLRGIEDCVRESDVANLKVEKERLGRDDVHYFRRSILNVTKDLANFRQSLVTKTSASWESEPVVAEISSTANAVLKEDYLDTSDWPVGIKIELAEDYRPALEDELIINNDDDDEDYNDSYSPINHPVSPPQSKSERGRRVILSQSDKGNSDKEEEGPDHRKKRESARITRRVQSQSSKRIISSDSESDSGGVKGEGQDQDKAQAKRKKIKKSNTKKKVKSKEFVASSSSSSSSSSDTDLGGFGGEDLDKNQSKRKKPFEKKKVKSREFMACSLSSSSSDSDSGGFGGENQYKNEGKQKKPSGKENVKSREFVPSPLSSSSSSSSDSDSNRSQSAKTAEADLNLDLPEPSILQPEEHEGRRRRKTSSKSLEKIKRVLEENESDQDQEVNQVGSGSGSDTYSDFNPSSSSSSDFSPSQASPSPPRAPKRKTNQKRKYFGKAKMSSQLENVDMSEMSDFKKYVLRSLLVQESPQVKIRNLAEHENKNGEGEEEETSNSAWSLLKKMEGEQKLVRAEYNQDVMTLRIRGVEMILDEGEKSVQCSQCPYNFTVSGSRRADQRTPDRMRNRLREHVLCKHDDAASYRCPVCPEAGGAQTCYNTNGFTLHLKTHIDGHPDNCPICGKPQGFNSTIKSHLWTHKNEEEKRAAAEEDEFYRRRLETENTTHGFACEICGKLYKHRPGLNRHMETHKSIEEREKELCPDCGKNIFKSSFRIHRTKVCIPKGAPMVKCPFCEKSFKHKQSFERHFKRTHSKDAEERPHQCHMCPKKFKVIGDLNHHLKNHAVELQYRCGKGCGKEFAVKRYWQRHEAACRYGEIMETGEELPAKTKRKYINKRKVKVTKRKPIKLKINKRKPTKRKQKQRDSYSSESE